MLFRSLPPIEDDLELDFIRLDLAAMKFHHFVTFDSTLENLQYRLFTTRERPISGAPFWNSVAHPGKSEMRHRILTTK